MTISEEAQDAFEELGADHQDASRAAKAIAQQIIEASASEELSLSGLVYDVWGLYNEGSPRCRFTAPYENRGASVRRGKKRGFSAKSKKKSPELPRSGLWGRGGA